MSYSISDADWSGEIRANLFGVRSRQGGASRKCPVDIFSERAGLKYGKVKSASARLFNEDMASNTESKTPKPLWFGCKLKIQPLPSGAFYYADRLHSKGFTLM